MTCECEESCDWPDLCDGTPTCCDDYLCPDGFERNSEGACIKPADCSESNYNISSNKAPKYLHVYIFSNKTPKYAMMQLKYYLVMFPVRI